MQNANQVVTKSTIFDTVWDPITSADENTLNVHISKIRNKLKKGNPTKDYIEKFKNCVKFFLTLFLYNMV